MSLLLRSRLAILRSVQAIRTEPFELFSAVRRRDFAGGDNDNPRPSSIGYEL